MRISALALLKMAMHAKSGGNIEVMGVMQGKVLDDTFIVMDAFALPVEGTETRVNAQAEAYEYMVDFLETNKVGSEEWRLVGCLADVGRMLSGQLLSRHASKDVTVLRTGRNGWVGHVVDMRGDQSCSLLLYLAGCCALSTRPGQGGGVVWSPQR